MIQFLRFNIPLTFINVVKQVKLLLRKPLLLLTSFSPEYVLSSHEVFVTLFSVLVTQPLVNNFLPPTVVSQFHSDAPIDVFLILVKCSQPLDDCSQPLDDCSLSEAHSCHP